MSAFDPDKIAAETMWLVNHPAFDEKPASIKEFLGEGYLDIESKIRPGLLQALMDIFGEEVNGNRIANYERALVTGGVGIGKTTFASICLPYMAHWVLCLRNPQEFFELLPGSRIAFMQMSTSEKQAAEVVFGDIFARIQHSEWFVNNYPYDPKFTKQIRFAKDIWILPGDSSETSFEGYNILAGILDEMDSHKTTEVKDYADVGYDTINSRIASRFTQFADDGTEAGHKGLIICIGQMKKGTGFAARKYKEFLADPKAYVVRMTIWESLGWNRYTRNKVRDSFWYDIKRKMIVPTLVAALVDNKNVIEIPNAYRKQFEDAPEKALRDLAGIPPAVSDPFISLVDRIEEARDRWIERHESDESPVGTSAIRPEFAKWFRGNGDPRKRHIHIDLATSGDGDALGMAMGYVESVVEIDGEKKPYIVIDCLIRIKARPGTEIMLSDVRRIIYDLKEEYGFRIYSVSMDGFQSTDTMQQLRKKKYRVDYLSVDKSTLPYEDLREAIYERRIEFPPYKTYIKTGDDKVVEVLLQELMELTDTGKKIDHPVGGSKDVADAVAGVTSTLMGDRTYRKGVTSIHPSSLTDDYDVAATGTDGKILAFPQGGGWGMGSPLSGAQAPVPPMAGGLMGLTIPKRLLPRK